MFMLVRVVPGQEPEVLQGYGPYDDGKDAADAAKWFMQYYGGKVQPRRIGDLPDWRERERNRVATGWYRQTTFDDLPEGWDLDPAEDYHCAKIYDDGDNVQISYFDSDQSARLDRRKHVRVGRYLYRHYPDLADDHERRLIALVDPPVEISFAKTRDEIRKAYLEGPDSCMSMATRPEWQGLPCHPVEIYAAGDLAVAYFRNRRGRVAARTVCWPERKQYGRTYGDSHRLEQALRAMGYTHAHRFQGARLLRIPAKRSEFSLAVHIRDGIEINTDGFVTPFFDNVNAIEDKGDHFLTVVDEQITDHSLKLHFDGGTHGVSRPMKFCPKMHYWTVDPFVYVRGAEQEWSRQAAEYHAFRCDRTGEWWESIDKYRVEMWGTYSWSREAFERYGFTCALSGRKCSKDDLATKDGMLVSRRYLRDLEREEERKRHDAEVKRARREGRDQYTFNDMVMHYSEPAWRRVEIRNPATLAPIDPHGPVSQTDWFLPPPINFVRLNEEVERSIARMLAPEPATVEVVQETDPRRRPWHTLIDNDEIRTVQPPHRRRR